ncbi:hypothetical protein ACVWYN_002680 [Pedobacter sp. UYP24]
MKLAALIARFRFYAEMHKAIRHDPNSIKKSFLHIEVQDLVKAAQSGLKLPALLIQTPEVEKTGSYDDVSEDWGFTFIIYQKLGKRDKSELIDECKDICDDIINMVALDVQAEILPSLVPGTNEGLFGPVVDDLYGWGVSLSVAESYDGEVNPAKWLHMTPDQP